MQYNFYDNHYLCLTLILLISFLFLWYFIPWLLKCGLCLLMKRILKFDVKITKIGISNARVTLAKDDKFLMQITFSNFGIKLNVLQKRSKTYFTIYCDRIIIDELYLFDLYECLPTKTQNNQTKYHRKRLKWIISMLRLFSLECSRIVLGFKLAKQEKSPLIKLLWCSCEFFVIPDHNRFNCQLKISNFDAKILCPSTKNDEEWNLLANFKSLLKIESVIIKKPKLALLKLQFFLGETRFSVLEEAFHELSEVTKHSPNSVQNIPTHIKQIKSHRKPITEYLNSIPQHIGLDIDKFELVLIRLDISRNLNLVWNKCYVSLQQPSCPGMSCDDSPNLSDHRRMSLGNQQHQSAYDQSSSLSIDTSMDNSSSHRDFQDLSDGPVVSGNDELLHVKLGCYGLNIARAMTTASSWKRLEFTGQYDRESFAVKCRVDNPCLIVNIDELTFWRELIHDASTFYRQLRMPAITTTKETTQLQQTQHLGGLLNMHYALKLEVNCSHRGQNVNSDSLAVVQIVNNNNRPGLEFGLKTLVASYEADASNHEPNKLIESIDLYSDINTAYCRIIHSSSINTNYRHRDFIDYYHQWDCAVFMGNVFLWLHRNRAGCLINQLQMEVSPNLVNTCKWISQTLLKNLGSQPATTIDKTYQQNPSSIDSLQQYATNASPSCKELLLAAYQMDLEFKLEHVDLFSVCSTKAFLRQQVRIIHLVKNNTENIEANIKFSRAIYGVLPADKNELYSTSINQNADVDGEFMFCEISHIKIEYHLHKHQLTLSFDRCFQIDWTTALHIAIISTRNNIRQFTLSLQSITKLLAGNSSASKPAGMPKQSSDLLKLNTIVELRAGFKLVAQLANQHQVVVQSDVMSFLWSKQHRSKFFINFLEICCDSHTIFSITNLSWKEITPTNKYRQDKEKLKLTDDVNKAWEIQSERTLISFPYKYDFHECYSEIVSMRKFIKKIHSQYQLADESSQPVTSTIPPDYIIFFKEFQLELKDDPFECQLLDNFLVLGDESEEHEKRILRLRNQIKKLVKTSGRTFKDSEYQRCLNQLDLQKQAQYIARISSLRTSRLNAMSSGGSGTVVNDNLLRWTITNLNLISLSDSDYYGNDNAVRHLQQIDADSPYPRDGVQFSTLWCRMISLNADNWVVQMREYMRPMWQMTDLYVWGRLVVAEKVASPLARRKVSVPVQDPWPNVEIDRSLSQLKFYHDFSGDMKEHAIVYGPNWEPCLQWINVCWERINRASRDPSPPISWWDKMRLRVHGKLYFLADVMHWYYAVSLDPYNNTEFFHWQWTDVRVNWENMKFVFDGNLDVFCRSASKYDGDSKLLHWPNLLLKIDIEWLCNGDPNDHFAVSPVSIENVLNKNHDTYALFRSYNVNLNIDFREKNPSSISSTRQNADCLKIVFYTNILKFFEKFKNCLRKVARPIRRGRQFKYFRKKKTPLGRHYKNVQVKFTMTQLDLTYWVSLAKKSGLRMLTGPISLCTTFHLDLEQSTGPLVRRAQTHWTIEEMRAYLRHGRLWLIENLVSDNATSDNSSASVHNNKYELMLIAYLRYERLKTTNTANTSSAVDTSGWRLHNSSLGHDSSNAADNFNTTSSTSQLPSSATDMDSDECDLTPKHSLKLVDLKVRWTETNRNLVYAMIDIYRHKTQLRKNLSAQALKSIKLQLNTFQQRQHQQQHEQQYQTNNKKLKSQSMNSQHTRRRSLSASYVNDLSTGQSTINSSRYSGAGGSTAIGIATTTNNPPMLDQLLREVDTARFYAYCDEEPEVGDVVDKLAGVELINSNEKIAHKWHLELINSQVMLKTDALCGYVIVSAATTRLDNYEYMPIWKESQLLTKSSLCGKLECMQYYATVGGGGSTSTGQWLNICDVEDQQINEDVLSGTPEVVGCGKAAGGVVSSHVGGLSSNQTNNSDQNISEKHSPIISNSTSTNSSSCDRQLTSKQLSSSITAASNCNNNTTQNPRANVVPGVNIPSNPINSSPGDNKIQLQRMISKCSCKVFYVSYDIADPNTLEQHLIPPLPLDEDEVNHSSEGATTLTIVHSNLNVVTNSLQYHMIVDIINDLILYVEPQRKARDDRNKVEFSLLSEDQLKVTILKSQEYLRNLVHNQLDKERELWKAVIERNIPRIKPLESQIKQLKNEIEQKNSALSQCIVIYQQLSVQLQKRDLHIRAAIATQQLQQHTTNTSIGGSVGGAISGIAAAVAAGGGGGGIHGNNTNTGSLGSCNIASTNVAMTSSLNKLTSSAIVVDNSNISDSVGALGGNVTGMLSNQPANSQSFDSFSHGNYHAALVVNNANNQPITSDNNPQSKSSILRATSAEVVRRNEVCFEHATWRMTENDGQIGLCDVELRGFIYSKVTREDDSGSHSFELNTVKVESLVGGSAAGNYREVLNMDQDSALNVGGPVLRINLVERAPVGGIKVNEAMEICIAPLVLKISKLFYSTMMPFFFPGKSEDGHHNQHQHQSSHSQDQQIFGTDNASFIDIQYDLINITSGLDDIDRSRKINKNPRGPSTESIVASPAIVFDVAESGGASSHDPQLVFEHIFEENNPEDRHIIGSNSNLKIEDIIFNQNSIVDSLCSNRESIRGSTSSTNQLLLMMMNKQSNLDPVSTSSPSANSLATTVSTTAAAAAQDATLMHSNTHRRAGSSNAVILTQSITPTQIGSASVVNANSPTSELMTTRSGGAGTLSNLPSSGNQTNKQHQMYVVTSSSQDTGQVALATTTSALVAKDPLQLMAERAKQNSMFLYVKIHGFPIRLSYRGEKQNALSINNIALCITPIEYHNKLWTWLDLIMEVKKSIYRELKIEIIKQKFKLTRNPISRMYNSNFNQKIKEEDQEKKKLEMLLGIYALPREVNKKKPNILKRVLKKP